MKKRPFLGLATLTFAAPAFAHPETAGSSAPVGPLHSLVHLLQALPLTAWLALTTALVLLAFLLIRNRETRP